MFLFFVFSIILVWSYAPMLNSNYVKTAEKTFRKREHLKNHSKYLHPWVILLTFLTILVWGYAPSLNYREKFFGSGISNSIWGLWKLQQDIQQKRTYELGASCIELLEKISYVREEARKWSSCGAIKIVYFLINVNSTKILSHKLFFSPLLVWWSETGFIPLEL